MWVEEVSKSEGRAVGHVTCTEKVADWAFSWIKADQLASVPDDSPPSKKDLFA